MFMCERGQKDKRELVSFLHYLSPVLRRLYTSSDLMYKLHLRVHTIYLLPDHKKTLITLRLIHVQQCTTALGSAEGHDAQP